MTDNFSDGVEVPIPIFPSGELDQLRSDDGQRSLFDDIEERSDNEIRDSNNYDRLADQDHTNDKLDNEREEDEQDR